MNIIIAANHIFAALAVNAANHLFIDHHGTSAAAIPVACEVLPPAELTAHPLRWLGPCRDGRAEGLGVLRAGGGEPFAFFVGRMVAGRPVQGVIMADSSQIMPAYRFDPARHAVPPDGNRPAETAATFRTAAAGANAAAWRFAAAGNRGSAAYYVRMARTIAGSEPGE